MAPQAESFNAIGVGNGFTTCFTFPDKIDVSNVNGVGAAQWTTLSGYTGSSKPDDESIEQSLNAAMQLGWNIYKFNVVGSSQKQSSSNDPDTDPFFTSISAFDSNVNSKLPHERVCTNTKRINLERKFEYDTPFQFGKAFVEIRVGLNIVKMYHGDTSDENNFLGYGTSGSVDASAGFLLPIVQPATQLYLSSFTFDENESSPTLLRNVAKTSFTSPTGQELYFMCSASARSSVAGTFGEPPETTIVSNSKSANGSDRKATRSQRVVYNYLVNEGLPDEELYTETSHDSASIEITGIDWYTY